jgi:hypothetical protein
MKQVTEALEHRGEDHFSSLLKLWNFSTQIWILGD